MQDPAVKDGPVRGGDTGIEAQRDQWRRTFATRPDFLGGDPSEPARAALQHFRGARLEKVLELGPGQGRDTLFFAAAGLHLTALDYAEAGLDQIATKAESSGLHAAVRTVAADVRDRLPFGDATFDAVYAHMLFCMALTTSELVRLAAEVHRVVRPGGLVVYTVRTTADPQYHMGVDHGDDRFEMGGFIVHFFDRPLIDRLAAGFEILEVADHEEGRLPRRLAAVTMRRIEPEPADA